MSQLGIDSPDPLYMGLGPSSVLRVRRYDPYLALRCPRAGAQAAIPLVAIACVGLVELAHHGREFERTHACGGLVIGVLIDVASGQSRKRLIRYRA